MVVRVSHDLKASEEIDLLLRVFRLGRVAHEEDTVIGIICKILKGGGGGVNGDGNKVVVINLNIMRLGAGKAA